MSMILSLGSNLGDRKNNLETALDQLVSHFELINTSSIIETAPVDYLDQPPFLNQLLEFKLPKIEPINILKITQKIEFEMGRVKKINKGPRNIDIDIIFFGSEIINLPTLIIPHHAWNKRDFILKLLKELNFNFQIENYSKNSESFALQDSIEKLFY